MPCSKSILQRAIVLQSCSRYHLQIPHYTTTIQWIWSANSHSNKNSWNSWFYVSLGKKHSPYYTCSHLFQLSSEGHIHKTRKSISYQEPNPFPHIHTTYLNKIYWSLYTERHTSVDALVSFKSKLRLYLISANEQYREWTIARPVATDTVSH